ncbi:hypothetical protein [Lentibacillus jeotgali]|uniref:hypothetical protein n=1 Tax=Lentibacillus jeotgali TaxID=558169 RepID=UPI00026258A1|nr:hypothetical protein [Lentibacillus jeotgali]
MIKYIFIASYITTKIAEIGDVLTFIGNVLVPLANLYIVFLVYKLTHRNLNPKLFVEGTIEDAKNKFDASVNDKISGLDFNQEGFPFPEVKHDMVVWKLRIHNNGDLPATNVNIEYFIRIQKKEFDILEGLPANERLVKFQDIKETLYYDYIPPGGYKEEDILYINGKFPQAKLYINKLQSKEVRFIKSPVHIDTYKHYGFEKIHDTDDGLKLIGFYQE